MPEDKDEEIFEVVDNNNTVIGRAQRGICHEEGLCHKAVNCLVFNAQGQLLLQRRSSRKKIGPGQWDLSLAEHLQPGETYAEAVVRGLQEELGIATSEEDLDGPLNPFHQSILEIPGTVKDVEIVTTYRLKQWEGCIQMDEDEVQAVKWVDLEDLYVDMARQPGTYTSWLQKELGMLQDSFIPEMRNRSGFESAAQNESCPAESLIA